MDLNFKTTLHDSRLGYGSKNYYSLALYVVSMFKVKTFYYAYLKNKLGLI